jgi:hypothetical protein
MPKDALVLQVRKNEGTYKLDFSHLEEEGQGIEEWGERNKVHLTPEKLCLLYQNPLRQS